MTDDGYEYEEELHRRMGMLAGHFGPVDLDGKPVKRTKQSHPYSYDGFVLWRDGSEDTGHAVYTDRLSQWDRDKFQRLCKKHMPDRRWDNAAPGDVQAFLSEYNDDPGLRLTAIMEWCNQATGYPTWSLHYKEGPGVLLKYVRKCIVEVFGDSIGDDAEEKAEKHTYLGRDDPGQWSPKAPVVSHTEMFLPSIDEGVGIIEKWSEVNDKLKYFGPGHFVEHINGAVSAVYKSGSSE